MPRSLYFVGGIPSKQEAHTIEYLGQAAIRDQKISNALRTIDTWYPGFENRNIPIPVEPNGASLDAQQFFRADNKSSGFRLMEKITDLDPDTEDGMVPSCLHHPWRRLFRERQLMKPNWYFELDMPEGGRDEFSPAPAMRNRLLGILHAFFSQNPHNYAVALPKERTGCAYSRPPGDDLDKLVAYLTPNRWIRDYVRLSYPGQRRNPFRQKMAIILPLSHPHGQVRPENGRRKRASSPETNERSS